jgi:hypothetical protein
VSTKEVNDGALKVLRPAREEPESEPSTRIEREGDLAERRSFGDSERQNRERKLGCFGSETG